MSKAEASSYAVAAAIGAVILTIAGYLVYAAPGEAVSFGYWIDHPIRFKAWLWAAVGALAGSGLYRITRS